MRALEIRIQRIFNNLIKQNKKLGSNTVLKQSTIVSSVQSPAAKVQHPASRVQHPESSVRPKSSVRSTAPRVRSPASRVQSPRSSLQGIASRVQHPAPSVPSSESNVQSPASRVQCPEFSVQHLRLGSTNSGMPSFYKCICKQSCSNYFGKGTARKRKPFDVCSIAATDSSKDRSGSFYKSCIEKASKHLQNDEEEEDLFSL